MRDLAIRDNVRADGRQCNEVRPIACRAGLLPCTHGSALFTRGETQTISVTTLGKPLSRIPPSTQLEHPSSEKILRAPVAPCGNFSVSQVFERWAIAFYFDSYNMWNSKE